jgi:transposase
MTSAPQQPLPQTLEAAHAVIVTLSDKLSATLRENELLKQKVDKLCRRMFGNSSEKVSPAQLALAFAQLPNAVSAPPAAMVTSNEVEPASSAARRRSTGRKGFPEHLRRKSVVVEPPEHELTCDCGQRKTKISEKVTERLDYEPANLVVVETVRPVYACQKCHEGVTVAATPTQAVERSAAGSGLLAHLITAKYLEHSPLYRIERSFARQGVELSRSTMCGQLALAEEALAPIGEEILRRLRAGPYLQFDDTSVLVLPEDDKARFYGKIWVYHSPLERLVAFDATETREHTGPLSLLEGFSGYLQGDAFSGNLTLRKKSPVFILGCMAHLRRYFVEALDKDPRAAHFIGLIKLLYKLEAQAREQGLSHAERRAMRQKQATPLLWELMRLEREMRSSVLPKSPLGEAFTYLRNQMRYVAQYIRDGRLEIDNTGAERALRGVAVGRKNYLFTGSMNGLRRAALLYSLVESAKLAGVEPWAYLKDVLDRLPTHPISRIGELLPREWAAARAATSAPQA